MLNSNSAPTESHGGKKRDKKCRKYFGVDYK